MVVEDDEEARAARKTNLENAGFAVLTASGSDAALLALEDAPVVDLVLTDIHLGGSKKTRAGVALAKRLRQIQPKQLPVVGYSGVFSERQLEAEESGLFNMTSGRNSKNWSQLDKFFADCYRLASEYREWRKEQAAKRPQAGLSSSKTDRSRTRGTFEAVLDLVDEADDGAEGFEVALKKLGYRLRLVSSDDFEQVLSAIPVWIRPYPEGEWEAQVYGFPVLNTFGPSEEWVVESMVNVMIDLHRQLSSAVAEGKPPQGPAAGLLKFLDKILRTA